MQANRRDFLKAIGGISAAATAAATTHQAHASAAPHDSSACDGVLVDLTLCVGCRHCEYECTKANGGDPGQLEDYEDQSPFATQRRPRPDQLTVVNAWDISPASQPTTGDDAPISSPVYAKLNCLHCNHPACASACIVGALKKQDNGAVTYDAWKCIGCRYCMVACPFQLPTYEYDNVFTPQVRKCQFCFDRTSQGKNPACVDGCPRQALLFGKRSELLQIAHKRINDAPDRYVDHVYGESEVGGTSWMYLSAVPFEDIGFLKLGPAAPPALTEAIQHGVFKHGIPPVALYGTLGAVMYLTRQRAVAATHAQHQAATRAEHQAAPRALATAAIAARLEHDAPDPPPRTPPHPRQPFAHHAPDDSAAPVHAPFFTPGVWLLLALAGLGLGFGLYRFLFGLGAATNLNQQYPWGLWIGVDVASGVALAAGGFTSAFLIHILHREHYHALARPALLTAMLGYTFVVIGLQADLGRYYNVWHPMFMWQGNSVLFEVGICVMCYLNVLYLEFAPILAQRFLGDARPRLRKLARLVHDKLERVMFLLIIAGCVLSCLHQSSLGNLLVIAPYKLHPLWWTPLSPLLFLISAIAVGFPMIVFESLWASWSLKQKPEMHLLGPLARFVPWLLGVYLALKLGDVIYRQAHVHLATLSKESICWLAEISLGVVVPMILLSLKAVRRSPRWLFLAAFLVVAGVLFNRVNVFLIGYTPPFAQHAYVPSIGEFAVTLGLVATLILFYRLIVTWFPVLHKPHESTP
jgi:Ni/Fe-hydrogenase subunit HybB-like protein/Fe-S-cluster-containing dehydrogenase component